MVNEQFIRRMRKLSIVWLQEYRTIGPNVLGHVIVCRCTASPRHRPVLQG